MAVAGTNTDLASAGLALSKALAAANARNTAATSSTIVSNIGGNPQATAPYGYSGPAQIVAAGTGLNAGGAALFGPALQVATTINGFRSYNAGEATKPALSSYDQFGNSTARSTQSTTRKSSPAEDTDPTKGRGSTASSASTSTYGTTSASGAASAYRTAQSYASGSAAAGAGTGAGGAGGAAVTAAAVGASVSVAA